MNFQNLEILRKNHPAWKLLNSSHASLIVSFLYKTFIAKNERVVSQIDLVESLEDELFSLRDIDRNNKYSKSALEYLNYWAEPERGWLRKFYRYGSDEVQFDITPATEKAIVWLQSLEEKTFVGTESRLLSIFNLLRELSEGSNEDPEERLRSLKKRRDEIDVEIAKVMRGELTTLDNTAQKERFLQFTKQAQELLYDFREVEQNFRKLDHSVREKIAKWDGSKGELLESIIGERDAISGSDQGSSFKAFWDFLMSSDWQEKFTGYLEKVLNLPTVQQMKPAERTRKIHYDWLEAGEYTQRTVAQLSQQLRKFLDDKAWLENKRIMDILRGIETKTLHVKQNVFKQNEARDFMEIDGVAAVIELPMERPLYSPALKMKLPNIQLKTGEEITDSNALYSQVTIDKKAILQHIRKSLQQKSQVTLGELCRERPLTQGLAELIAYLELASERQNNLQIIVKEDIEDVIEWQLINNKDNVKRFAHIPRIIYLRFNPKETQHE